MEQKQTAVEWFATQIMDNWNDITAGTRNIAEFIEQAKEMEKKQKIEFARHCLEKANRTFDLDILTSFIDVHQYYNEEYGKDTTDNTNL